MNSALATTRGTPGSIARCQPRGGGRVYDSFFFFFLHTLFTIKFNKCNT